MIIKYKLIKAHFNLLQDEIQHCCNINCKRVIIKQHVHSCIQMDLLPEGGGGGACLKLKQGCRKPGKNSSTKINGLVTGTRGYKRESLKHGYYRMMTFCSQ